MTAGARVERAYFARLVAMGLPADTRCAVCGGRLSWIPAGVIDELADSFSDRIAIGEALMEVRQHGGDSTSPVSLCRSCWTLDVWFTGTHGVDEVAPRVLDGGGK